MTATCISARACRGAEKCNRGECPQWVESRHASSEWRLIAALSLVAYSLVVTDSFFTSFLTIVICVGGGMALASVLPVSKRRKRGAFAPLIVVTMIFGTRYGLLEGLGPSSDFTGNPTGQVTGVLLGMLVVWLVFFRESRVRERPGSE